MLAIFFLFIAFIVFLNLFRHRISQQIQIISLLVFKSNIVGIIFYSLFFLPGVIIHELSHLLIASLLGVPTGTISIFPTEIKEGKMRLGYVESAESDPVRESLIGLAPTIIGMIVILSIASVSYANSTYLKILLWYLLFSVANTMFMSKEDSRSWWGLPLFVVVLALFLYVFGLTGLVESFIPKITLFFINLNMALLLAILIDISVIAVLFVIQKLLVRLTGHLYT